MTLSNHLIDSDWRKEKKEDEYLRAKKGGEEDGKGEEGERKKSRNGRDAALALLNNENSGTLPSPMEHFHLRCKSLEKFQILTLNGRKEIWPSRGRERCAK